MPEALYAQTHAVPSCACKSASVWCDQAKGVRAILTKASAGHSQEGVRPGQRLLSISDPIRTSEEWEISTTTSLSRIRDAVQFRRPRTISFQLSVASVEDDSSWSLQKASLWVGPSLLASHLSEALWVGSLGGHACLLAQDKECGSAR